MAKRLTPKTDAELVEPNATEGQRCYAPFERGATSFDKLRMSGAVQIWRNTI